MGLTLGNSNGAITFLLGPLPLYKSYSITLLTSLSSMSVATRPGCNKEWKYSLALLYTLFIRGAFVFISPPQRLRPRTRLLTALCLPSVYLLYLRLYMCLTGGYIWTLTSFDIVFFCDRNRSWRIAGNLWNYVIKNTRKYLLYYLKGLIFNWVSELLIFFY